MKTRKSPPKSVKKAARRRFIPGLAYQPGPGRFTMAEIKKMFDELDQERAAARKTGAAGK